MHFFRKYTKNQIFKKSKNHLVVSKMKHNSFSCSIGIWNYHLALSKSESRIFLRPFASPLWPASKKTTEVFSMGILYIKLLDKTLQNCKDWIFGLHMRIFVLWILVINVHSTVLYFLWPCRAFVGNLIF